jgi:hypothetical protein
MRSTTSCFLPIHVHEGTRGKPVAAILRSGKTPGGIEVRTIVKRAVARIRGHWPKDGILARGDGHYGRPDAMAWGEANGVAYIFGLGGDDVLANMVRCGRRAVCAARRAARFEAANLEDAALARLEATPLGLFRRRGQAAAWRQQRGGSAIRRPCAS